MNARDDYPLLDRPEHNADGQGPRALDEIDRLRADVEKLNFAVNHQAAQLLSVVPARDDIEMRFFKESGQL